MKAEIFLFFSPPFFQKQQNFFFLSAVLENGKTVEKKKILLFLEKRGIKKINFFLLFSEKRWRIYFFCFHTCTIVVIDIFLELFSIMSKK